MTFSSVTALRGRPLSRTRGAVGVEASDRWLANRVWATWGFLTLNVLTFAPGVSIFPIPSIIGKGITQGSLVAALLLAMTCNRKLAFRPSVFMCLVTLLAIEGGLTELYAQFPFGTGIRVARFLGFAAVMWLLTPFWGRRDMLLLRCHVKTLLVIFCLQIIGLIVAPGKTLGNRFSAVIWPIVGTQVGHYMAILLGLLVILWFCGRISGRALLLLGPATAVMLILTHTRTALVACIAGLLIAGLSLITAMPRVRTFFTVVLVLGGTVWISASSAITSWLVRGENAEQLSNLSGRTNFWGPLLAYPRTPFQEIFGFGMQNGSFNGMPIDSNWMLSYENQGLWGVTICGLIVVFLFLSASFAERGPQRAIALFLIVYCLIASYTEDGFTEPTTYLLDLFLAASLLTPFGGSSSTLSPVSD